jgi:hypothetical protein
MRIRTATLLVLLTPLVLPVAVAYLQWATLGLPTIPPTVILHSRADDVVPFADSEELAKNSGATLVEVGSDHRLADPEPLAAMLKACNAT